MKDCANLNPNWKEILNRIFFLNITQKVSDILKNFPFLKNKGPSEIFGKLGVVVAPLACAYVRPSCNNACFVNFAIMISLLCIKFQVNRVMSVVPKDH